MQQSYVRFEHSLYIHEFLARKSGREVHLLDVSDWADAADGIADADGLQAAELKCRGLETKTLRLRSRSANGLGIGISPLLTPKSRRWISTCFFGYQSFHAGLRG